MAGLVHLYPIGIAGSRTGPKLLRRREYRAPQLGRYRVPSNGTPWTLGSSRRRGRPKLATCRPTRTSTHPNGTRGSFRSDQPDDPALWDLDRFVDEVEQVRVALGLDADNFVLLGQSWGGLLAIEYALRYQDHLKGLVVSNMMSSIPQYNEFAEQVLMPMMDQKVLAEIKQFEADHNTDDPRYEELLMEHHYAHHVCRLPLGDWPDTVMRTFAHLNPEVYVPMQGPSELGAGGSLVDWDRSADLDRIEVPALVIGAEHDTMDPAHMRWMAEQFPRGTYLHCPDGSHLAQYDDPHHYFPGLIDFLQGL